MGMKVRQVPSQTSPNLMALWGLHCQVELSHRYVLLPLIQMSQDSIWVSLLSWLRSVTLFGTIAFSSPSPLPCSLEGWLGLEAVQGCPLPSIGSDSLGSASAIRIQLTHGGQTRVAA